MNNLFKNMGMEKSVQIKSSSIFYLQLKVLVVLILLNFFSLLAEYYLNYFKISIYTLDKYVVKMFSFFWEHNIPTYFSTINLLISAGCLYFISKLLKGQAGADFQKQWLYLSYIFVYLALDESLMIHEVFVTPTKYVINHYFEPEKLGILYHAWVVPYIAAVLILSLFYYKFIFSLPQKFMLRFMAAGALFLFGAVGLEMFEGNLAEVLGEDSYRTNLHFKLWVALEETLEMFGIILFIYSLMQYIEDHTEHKNLFVTVSSRKAEVASVVPAEQTTVAA